MGFKHDFKIIFKLFFNWIKLLTKSINLFRVQSETISIQKRVINHKKKTPTTFFEDEVIQLRKNSQIHFLFLIYKIIKVFKFFFIEIIKNK